MWTGTQMRTHGNRTYLGEIFHGSTGFFVPLVSPSPLRICFYIVSSTLFHRYILALFLYRFLDTGESYPIAWAQRCNIEDILDLLDLEWLIIEPAKYFKRCDGNL